MIIACAGKEEVPNHPAKRKSVSLIMPSDTCHINIDSLYTCYYQKYDACNSMYVEYNSMRNTIDVLKPSELPFNSINII